MSPLHDRGPDEGEGEPEARGGGQNGPDAGGGDQRALQHHLLRHAGRDPALPPDPRARLQGADAAPPAAADRLLPKSHGQAGGGAAEVRQRVKSFTRGSPFGSDFTVMGDPSPPSASLVESRERPRTAGGTFEIRIMTDPGILCVQ